MSFIKRGDGKIVNVFQDEEQLTEEQRKSVKKAIQQPNNTSTDTSEKKSGS